MNTPEYLVAIETGGTKTLCRVEDERGAVVGAFRFPTLEPKPTIEAVCQAILASLPPGRGIAAVGVATFGPVDLAGASITYGRILETTKPHWRDFDLVGALMQRLGAPVALDTDVNAAALAEQILGIGRGLRSVAYVTVGTGIGGGLALAGRTLKGGVHPEIGHLRVRRTAGDHQASLCGYHDDCAEGLAAGPAIQARLQGRALADAPEIQRVLVDYLGQLCAALVLAWSPQRIAMGGGVLSDVDLLGEISVRMRSELGGYGASRIAEAPDYLAKAALADPGLMGAMLIARALTGAEG